MVRITFVQPNGTAVEVEAEPGFSVMEAAVNNGVQGIDADCGGQCACATCHVIIDPEWLDRLPPRGDMEEAMLDNTIEVCTNSRLACQVNIAHELDGMVVHMPSAQY